MSGAASPAGARAAQRARRVALLAIAGIAGGVVAAVLRSTGGWAAAWLGLGLAAPVLLPLRGILRRDRRTYAWATLCVTPYVVYGITESVANPAARALAEFVLFAAIVLFWALVAYLRVTRPRAGAAQGS